MPKTVGVLGILINIIICSGVRIEFGSDDLDQIIIMIVGWAQSTGRKIAKSSTLAAICEFLGEGRPLRSPGVQEIVISLQTIYGLLGLPSDTHQPSHISHFHSGCRVSVARQIVI